MSDARTGNPQISAQGMIAVIWVETAVAIVLVGMRFFFRISRKDRFTVDDTFVLIALLCMVASSGMYTAVLPTVYWLLDIEAGKAALGPNLFSDGSLYLKCQFAIIILFWTTLWSVKAAFLAFYKQMFGNGFVGPQKAAWWAVAAFTLLTYLSNFILQFFACVPFNNYFQLAACESEHNVFVSNASLYYSTASDIACDILIMILPTSILCGLRKNIKTKAALGSLFCAGLIIVLFALLRLLFTLPNQRHVNPEWLAIWSSTEAMIAVAVSCAPPFRKYFAVRSPSLSVRKMSNRSPSTGQSDSKSNNSNVKSARDVSGSAEDVIRLVALSPSREHSYARMQDEGEV